MLVDDVLDLAAAGADRAGLGAALDGRHRPDHEALAGAVHRPVAAHRRRSTRTSRRPTPATRWSPSSAGSARCERTFDAQNDELYDASFKAQFISGLIMPVMMFVGNLNYVVIAVVGGLRVAHGTLSLGEVQAFIQYTRQFTQPLTAVASMANLLQSGVASAERVFELLDAEEEVPDVGGEVAWPERTGEVRFEDVSFRYEPDKPADRGPLAGRAPRRDRRHRRSDRRRQDHAGQPGDAVLRARRRPDHARRRRRHRAAARRAAGPDRHGAAGRLAVRGHDPRQHRLRPARRLGGGDPAGRAGDVRRPVRALAARRLRHRDRRGGRQPVRAASGS